MNFKLFDVDAHAPEDDQVAVVKPWRHLVVDPDHAAAWIVAGDVDGDGEMEIVGAPQSPRYGRSLRYRRERPKLDGTRPGGAGERREPAIPSWATTSPVNSTTGTETATWRLSSPPPIISSSSKAQQARRGGAFPFPPRHLTASSSPTSAAASAPPRYWSRPATARSGPSTGRGRNCGPSRIRCATAPRTSPSRWISTATGATSWWPATPC